MSWHRPARAAASLRAGRPLSPAELTRRTRSRRRLLLDRRRHGRRRLGRARSRLHVRQRTRRHTIAATFSFNGPYTIDASAGHGRHDRAEWRGIRRLRHGPGLLGRRQRLLLDRDVAVDGSSIGAVTGYTFTNVHGAHTIAATFSLNGPYTIDASAGTGGTIAPSGAVSVACGADQAFTGPCG
jgi:hypothetical protein